MTKRFIISTSNIIGNDQQKKFAELLSKSNLNWWHWLPNTWLVVDHSGMFSASSFGKALRDVAPSTWFVVFECTPSSDWMGYGPTGSGNIESDMLAWIKKHWVNADPLSDFLM